jgi:hypothetical protein
MAQPKRFAARTAIFCAVSLSPGCRLLYLYLDDHARESGRWFMKQSRIAVELGVSRRTIQEWLYELEASGRIEIVSEPGKSSWYVMDWVGAQQAAHPESPGCAVDCAGGAQQAAQVAGMDMDMTTMAMSNSTSTLQVLRSTVCGGCGNFHEGEERVRCSCGGVHDPSTATEVVPLEETRRLLHIYVQQCRLPWPAPDEEICIRTLAAAGGSLVALTERLRFLLLNRRLAPSESYGWFPRVCALEQRRSA